MTTTCFKNLDKNGSVYYRHTKLPDSRWRTANYSDTADENSGIFCDDNGNTHPLSSIYSIGVDNGNITTLYIMNPNYYEHDENSIKTFPVAVTDPEQVKNIIDYLNRNKCNK